MNLLKMQQAFGRLVRDPSKQLISLNGFSKGSAEHTRYNRDWLQQHEGTAELVVKPETSEEVSAILRTANAERIPIHIQGGNTGLVGGSIALNGTAMLLSMDRMSKILNFDSSSGVVHCEAGAVLQNLHTHVEERGFRFPLGMS
jgi:FAD/FMN-containing dehydrogenase